MMRRLATRDVVLICAMQFFVGIAGTFLVRHWADRFASLEAQAPFLVSVLAKLGLLSLAPPLGWLAWVWRVNKPTLPPKAKIRAFAAGLGFVLALALLFGATALRAWFAIDRLLEQKMIDATVLRS